MYPTLDLQDLYQRRIAIWDNSWKMGTLFDVTHFVKKCSSMLKHGRVKMSLVHPTMHDRGDGGGHLVGEVVAT